MQEGEKIVLSGQFLLDSESRLREAIQKMLDVKMGKEPSNVSDADDLDMDDLEMKSDDDLDMSDMKMDEDEKEIQTPTEITK